MIDQLGVLPEQIMYVGDDALNDVAPARAMGMVSVWYKQEDAEIEPLEEEVDFTINSGRIINHFTNKNDNKGENYGSIY